MVVKNGDYHGTNLVKNHLERIQARVNLTCIETITSKTSRVVSTCLT